MSLKNSPENSLTQEFIYEFKNSQVLTIFISRINSVTHTQEGTLEFILELCQKVTH